MQTQRTRKVHKNMSTYRDGPTGTVRPLEECPRCGQEVQTSLWSARSAGYQSRCDELGFPSPTLSISTLCTHTRTHATTATEYARQHIWVAKAAVQEMTNKMHQIQKFCSCLTYHQSLSILYCVKSANLAVKFPPDTQLPHWFFSKSVLSSIR